MKKSVRVECEFWSVDRDHYATRVLEPSLSVIYNTGMSVQNFQLPIFVRRDEAVAFRMRGPREG
jgi:hypothetical protein